MQRLIPLLALTVLSSLTLAQEVPKGEIKTPDYIPYGNLSGAKKEDVDRAGAQGVELAKKMLELFDTRQTPEIQKMANTLKRRADDIADATISQERDQVLEFLGISPQSATALYYFVTWEMPLEMLRSYAIDAMWSGGTLVFRGVPPGKPLTDFLLKDLRSLVYGKGASANISLDPRLFDAYQISVAPTIVLSNVRGNFSCQGAEKTEFMAGDQPLSYDRCPALDPTMYNKISGAVSTQYALQTFLDNGAEEARPFMKALAKGFSASNPPGPVQQPFQGKWDSVLSPSDAMSGNPLPAPK